MFAWTGTNAGELHAFLTSVTDAGSIRRLAATAAGTSSAYVSYE